MTLTFDESVRDNLVEQSELFKRFVRKKIQNLNHLIIGHGETKVFQVNKLYGLF